MHKTIPLHPTLFLAWALCLVWFAAPSPALAADADALPKYLPEYLAEAAENNPELRAAFQEWKASLEQEAVVTALPDPRFSFAWFVQPVETRTGPQQFKYGLSQALPWFGTLGLKGEQALARANAKKAEFDQRKLAIFRSVKTAYYEYAYLTQAIRIAEENKELLRYLESVVRARYTAGSGAYSGVVRAQVELGKIEDRLTSLRRLRRPAAARLMAAMGRTDYAAKGDLLPAPPAIPLMRMQDAPEALLAGFKDTNPGLRALADLQDAERAGVDLAEKDFYPSFNVGAEYIQTGTARSPDVTNENRDPVIFGLSFTLPFDQSRREAQLRAAKARVRAAGYKREARAQSLRADLEMGLFQYDEALRKVALYRDNLIPKAEQALGVTVEGFQAGEATSGELIDAERTLIEFQLALQRALADQAQRFADIEVLVGRELPCEIHGALEPVADTSTQIPAPGGQS